MTIHYVTRTKQVCELYGLGEFEYPYSSEIHNNIESRKTDNISYEPEYRVTIQLVQNLPLTSKQKFRFGLARPHGLDICFEVNRRFCTG